MKKISENYLFINKQSDFTNSLLKYFYQRLGIFLCLDLDKSPTVIFTSNENKIAELYDDDTETNYGRAFYDETTNLVVFDARRYDKKSETFLLYNEYETIKHLNGNVSQYKYIIPLSDVYHELIHSVQYKYGLYNSTDMLEATDELLTYFITGQYNIDYKKATLSLWYVAKHVLKINKNRFYVFIRDSIVDPNFSAGYYMINKRFVRMLAKNYNGDFKKFMNRFKIDFYYPELEEEFTLDIQYIHDLIFYKY
jgi:hypothetical protein